MWPVDESVAAALLAGTAMKACDVGRRTFPANSRVLVTNCAFRVAANLLAKASQRARRTRGGTLMGGMETWEQQMRNASTDFYTRWVKQTGRVLVSAVTQTHLVSNLCNCLLRCCCWRNQPGRGCIKDSQWYCKHSYSSEVDKTGATITSK